MLGLCPLPLWPQDLRALRQQGGLSAKRSFAASLPRASEAAPYSPSNSSACEYIGRISTGTSSSRAIAATSASDATP